MQSASAAQCRPLSLLTATPAADSRASGCHLNQIELARRWRISPRTLERWRCLHQGPALVKIGGRVVYRLSDIEAFEVAQRRDSATAENPNAPAGRCWTPQGRPR
jgi:hypothetical protein